MRLNTANLLFLCSTRVALGSVKTSSESPLQLPKKGPLDAPVAMNCGNQVGAATFDDLYDGVTLQATVIPETKAGSSVKFISVDGGIVYHMYPANDDKRNLVNNIRDDFDRAYECLIGSGASPEFIRWFVDLTRRVVDSDNDKAVRKAYIHVAQFLQGSLPGTDLNYPGLSEENIEKSISEMDTGRIYTTGFDKTAQRMVVRRSIYIPEEYRNLMYQLGWRIDETGKCDKQLELVKLRGFLIATHRQFGSFDKLLHDSEVLLAQIHKKVEDKEAEISESLLESVDETLILVDRANTWLLLIQSLTRSILDGLFVGFFPRISSPLLKCSSRFYIFNHPQNPMNDEIKCSHQLLTTLTYAKSQDRDSVDHPLNVFRQIVSPCLHPRDRNAFHVYASNIRETLRCRLNIAKVEWDKLNADFTLFLDSGNFRPDDMKKLTSSAEELWLTTGLAVKDISQAFELIQR